MSDNTIRVPDRRRVVAPGLLFLLLGLVSGCGGGGGRGVSSMPQAPGSGVTASGAGRVTITLQWPQAPSGELGAQAIPAQTQSMAIRLEDPQNSSLTLAPPVVLNRDPAASTDVTQSFPNVRVGAALVRVSAFAAANGGGQKLAEATGTTTVVQGQTASVSVLLARITQLSLTPTPLVIGHGKTARLNPVARDSAGNLLFVRSDALEWSSSDTGAAIVDDTGQVTGVGTGGTATITVRDVDPPNRVATAVVRLDATPPQIATPAPVDKSFVPRANPTLSARIVDPSPSTGLNLTNAQLQIDGAQRVLSSSDLTLQPDGSAVLSYPAPNLAEGLHRVHFEIEDNGGSRAVGDWAFSVDTAAPLVNRVRYVGGQATEQSEVVLSTDPNVVTFIFDLPQEFRADISDLTAGLNTAATAFTIEVVRIFDDQGKPVNDTPRAYSFSKFTPDTLNPDHQGIVSFVKTRDPSPTQPGIYTITITARDTVGNVTPRAPLRFSVYLPQ